MVFQHFEAKSFKNLRFFNGFGFREAGSLPAGPNPGQTAYAAVPYDVPDFMEKLKF